VEIPSGANDPGRLQREKRVLVKNRVLERGGRLEELHLNSRWGGENEHERPNRSHASTGIDILVFLEKRTQSIGTKTRRKGGRTGDVPADKSISRGHRH